MSIDRSISLFIYNGYNIDCALVQTVANPTVGDPVFRKKGRSASNQIGNWSDDRFGRIERQIKAHKSRNRVHITIICSGSRAKRDVGDQVIGHSHNVDLAERVFFQNEDIGTG
jgi:hypothetical protein